MVNSCINDLNAFLGIDTKYIDDNNNTESPTQNNNNNNSILLKKFICDVNPNDHLKFISNWDGLNVKQSVTAPTNKKDYDRKSRNWLNGRRAPNYGNTLFPLFIDNAVNYIEYVINVIYPNNVNNINNNIDDSKHIYKQLLLFSVLL